MCFSPVASFAGGAVISAIGVATVRKVHKPSQILFASIPLFFGFQQVAEGLLWLALKKTGYDGLQDVSAYIFLVMAQVIWPLMIPLASFLMEESARKKKILLFFIGIGAILSSYYSFCLIKYTVTPQIMGFHIQYNNDFPESISMVAFIFYIIAAIGPLFVSSIRRMYIFGILATLSCLVTGIFYAQYLTSVWCFFAALISGVIYWILTEMKIKFNFEKLMLLKVP